MAAQDRKVVIVTGASQGIGAGIVTGYRREDWAVVATSGDDQRGGAPCRPRGRRGPYGSSTTADRSSARQWILAGSTPRHDAASTSPSPSPTTRPRTSAAVVGVNLTGFFRLTSLDHPHAGRGTGHVVNITPPSST